MKEGLGLQQQENGKTGAIHAHPRKFNDITRGTTARDVYHHAKAHGKE